MKEYFCVHPVVTFEISFFTIFATDVVLDIQLHPTAIIYCTYRTFIAADFYMSFTLARRIKILY